MKKIGLIWGVIIASISLLFVLTPVVIYAVITSIGNIKRRMAIIMIGWRIWGKTVINWSCLADVYQEDHRTDEEIKQRPLSGLHISNHMSFLDIPLTLLHFQIPPIMKKQVLYIPLFGFLGWASGSLIVDRKQKNSRKKALKAAIERLTVHKVALHYYPEGTRSKTGKPRSHDQIKDALIRIAYKENIPVYPSSLYGTFGSLKGGLQLFSKLGIINHAKVLPENFESAEDFVKHCWGTVSDGYYMLESKCANLES